MLISIRTLLASIIVVVGIVAAAVAFAPVYLSAVSSVKDVVNSLRGEVGERIQANVIQFFSEPQLQISSLMVSSQLTGMNVSDKFTMIPWLGATSITAGLATYAGFDDGSFLYISISGQPANVVRVSLNRGYPVVNESVRFSYNLTTRTNTTALPAAVPTSYDPTTRPWYPPLRAAQSWSSVYLDSSGDYSVLTVGGPFGNESGGTFGAFAMDFPTTAVVTYLQKQQVGKTGRVLLVDRNSRGFLGGNWETASVVNDGGVLRMATLQDVGPTDAHVARAVGGLGEGYLLNCTTPCKTTMEGQADVDALYVDVLQISDAYGLDMRLVLLLPAKDFLDGVDKDSKTSIGATCGAVVGLLLVAVLVGHVALAPLSVLEERLYAASSLCDDPDDEPAGCSFLSEIANIEAAFATLRAELARVKSFVPQSVLQRMNDGDDAEEEGTEQGTERGTEMASKHPSQQSSAAATHVTHATHVTAGAAHLAHRRRSNVSSAASRAKEKKGAPLLNVVSGLTSRQVTLLTANVLGFHGVAAGAPSACVPLHTRYLEIIGAAAAKHRGVFDTFSGDRAFISFNASNNVAMHVTQCAATIVAIEDAVRKLPAAEQMTVRLAGASGRVLAGNMGSSAVKRFTIVGAAVTQSVVLLQLAKMWGVGNLVSAAAMDTMEFTYNVQAVGAAKLPSAAAAGTKGGGAASYSVVGSVLQAKAVGASDEWMYELNAGGALEEDLKALKAAFALLADQLNGAGGVGKAELTERLDAVQTKSLQGYLRLEALLQREEPPMGAYYDSVCGF